MISNSRPRLQLLPLEERSNTSVTLSAPPGGTALLGSQLPATPVGEAESVSHELVVIDSRVDNLQSLLGSVLNASQLKDVVVLNPEEDGLDQLDAILKTRHDLTAIHVISHGQDGGLLLGSSWIDSAEFEKRAAEVQGWRSSLAPGADILLYGCDVAEDSDGRAFVNLVAGLTGADVAASSNVTGNRSLGGDWNLEYATGPVTTTGIALPEWGGLLNTFIVSNNSDSGAGSLRQAILDANTNLGTDAISFAIPGSGPQTIQPATPLPAVTDQVFMDASTQPGYAGAPLINIDGSLAGSGANGLVLAFGSDGSLIRGLAINRFAGDGILITGLGNDTIAGNYIGTNPAGTTGLGNGSAGIELNGASGNTIGGNTAAEGNLIVGNGGNGITVTGSNNIVLGNVIGMALDGVTPFGNGGAGVVVDGLLITGANNVIGGVAAGDGNIIANNAGDGVKTLGLLSTNNAIIGNSMFANGQLGIDLNGDGVTPNVLLGLGLAENYPVLTSVSTTGSTISLSGTIFSTALSLIRIDFYSNNPGENDPSGHGEGRVYLGSTSTTTGLLGGGSFNVTLPVSVPAGSSISATATADFGLLNFGSTSEFSNQIMVPGFVVSPPSATTTTEAGGSANFSVALSTQPTGNVTIPVSSSNTGEGTVNTSSLTFTPANWNVPQTVTVTGVDDQVVDGNQPYTIVLGTAASTDPNYNGLNPPDVSLTNLDNDTAGFSAVMVGSSTTNEAGGTASFTVALNSQPTADVTIPVSSSNTGEGTVSVTQVTFTPANWNIPQTVIVTGVDDQVQDGNQPYAIILGAATSADPVYNGLDPADVPLTNLDNDTAGFSAVVVGGATTTEGGGTANFTVALSSQPTGDVTIPVSSSNTGEGTVSVTQLTFTPANWNVPQTVTVTGVDDQVADGNQPYTIVLGAATSSDPNFNGLDPADIPLTNLDNDTAGFSTVVVGGTTTSESGGTASFTLALSSQPTGDVTIPVSSSNTGEGTVNTASITFTPANWNIPQTVIITGVDDQVADGNQSYSIILGVAVSSDPNFNGLDPTDVVCTNTDNDTAGVATAIIGGSSATTESGGTVSFTMALSSQPTADVIIPVSSSNTGEGTANTASLTFTPANWNIPQIVIVTGVDDQVQDGNQPYTIILGAATSTDPNYNGLDPTDVALTNLDNDTAGFSAIIVGSSTTTEAGGTVSFNVTLNSQPAGDVTIPVSSSNTGEGTVNTSSLTFTPANWNIPQTVTVTGVDDQVADGNQPYTIVLGAATSADPVYNGLDPADVPLTNLDNDTAGFSAVLVGGSTTSEAGGTASFTMALSSQPTADVTIPVSSSNTGEGTVNTTSLTFTPANWNIPQTVIITGVDDQVADGNQTYSIILGAAASTDPNYDGLDPTDVSLTNLDNDTAGFSAVVVGSSTTTEGGGTASFTVTLNSQPTGDVTIPVSSSNTAEGTASVTQLTFTPANWNVPQTVIVTGVDDQVQDGNQPYTIVLGAATSADPNFNGLDPADVPLTNLDNDTAGVSVAVIGSATTTESGGTASFTVVLNSQPTGDVTIPVNSSNIAEGTASVTQLTFTPANWNIPQTVIIAGVDDQVADGNQTYSIILGVAVSTDPNFNGLDPTDVACTNTDNDTAGVATAIIGGSSATTESGGTVSFTMALSSQPTADVTIPVSSSNPAEGTANTASLTFTPANWNIPQTVIVTGVDDQVQDGNQPYSIILGAATSADPNYNGLNPTDVALTNLDNDTAGFSPVLVGGSTTSEAGGTASFTVVLNSQPTGDVTIPVSSSNTAEGTVSVSQLTFTPANWNIPQTVIVTGVDDQVADGNQPYTVLLGAAVSVDPNYSGLDPADLTLTNLDNDTAGFSTNLVGGSSTTEAGGTVSFTMALGSQPTGNVTIPVSSSNTGEGTAGTALLTFTPANWNIPQTVTVTGIDDHVVDGNQAYSIILGAATSTDPNYNGLDPADLTLTNIDNDTAGFVIPTIANPTTSEGGGSVSFVISLSSQPTGNVTLPVSSSNTGEGTVNKASLTFTPANWNLPQTMIVTGIDDQVADGNQRFAIRFGRVVSTDVNFDGLDPTDIAFTNIDNDTVGYRVAANGWNTTEVGGMTSFTVVLDSQPTSDVSIPVSSSNTGEGIVSTSSLTFTAANWNIPQTVTVTGVDDQVIDGNQTYKIRLAAPSGEDFSFNSLAPREWAMTNEDNDHLAVPNPRPPLPPQPPVTQEPESPVTQDPESPPPTQQVDPRPRPRVVGGGPVLVNITVPKEVGGGPTEIDDGSTTSTEDPGTSGNPTAPPVVAKTTGPGRLGSYIFLGTDDGDLVVRLDENVPPVNRPPEKAPVLEPRIIVPPTTVVAPVQEVRPVNVASEEYKPEQGPAPREVRKAVAEAIPTFAEPDALDELEKNVREFANQNDVPAKIVLATGFLTTVGVIAWSVRSICWIIGAMVSAAPAWKPFDPLVVLASRDKRAEEEEDKESLQSIAS